MILKELFVFLLIVSVIKINYGFESFPVERKQPEQVHISYGANPGEMVITWTTFDSINTDPIVEYGIKKLDKTATGQTTKFTDGGSEKRVMFIHRVTLSDLEPGTTYLYHVGCDYRWSPIFWFTAMRNGTDWSPRIIAYGDLGNANGRSLPNLQHGAQAGSFDAVHHVGDFAYDMDSNNARVGDQFMREIEAIAAYVPYMATPGNHEQAYNFSNYDNRFSMVDWKTRQVNNHFYSYNIGPAHVISFSTEFYYFLQYGTSQLYTQFAWLEQDLKEANKPENRAERPWIITLGHRPMYCDYENSEIFGCQNRSSLVRKGLPNDSTVGLEDLFYKYGVDLELWGHEHIYERLFPIYNQQVYNGSFKEPYTNPGAPVHIITGSAGNAEGIDQYVIEPAEWNAIRIPDYGFSLITIHNGTHLTFEQISADKNHQVVDKITLIKDSHGPYPKRDN